MARRARRKTAFGSCMSKKLKGRHFRSSSTQHRALGAAARSCAKKRRRRVPALRSLMRRSRNLWD